MLLASLVILHPARDGRAAPTWTRHFELPSRDGLIVRADASTLLLVGHDSLRGDPWLVALDGDGQAVMPARTLPGGASLSCACQAAGGGARLGGWLNSQIWIVDLDPSGAIVSQVKYGSLRSIAEGCITTQDGGQAWGVVNEDSSTGQLAAGVLKTNVAGSAEWLLIFPAGANMSRAVVTQLLSGDILLVSTVALVPPYADLTAVLLNSTGSIIWSRFFGDPALTEDVMAVVAQADGGAILFYEAGPPSASVPHVASIARNGAVTWSKQVQGAQLEWSGARGTSRGAVATFRIEGPSGTWGSGLLEINASGDILWVSGFESEVRYQETNDFSIDADGHVIVPNTLIVFPGTSIVAQRLTPSGQSEEACLSPWTPTLALTDAVLPVAPWVVTAVNTPPNPILTAVVETPIVLDITDPCAVRLPPTEVSPPGSPTPLLFASKQDLTWDDAAASDSDSFLVYRAALPTLRAGTWGDCFASGLLAPAATDPADPPPATGWFYLVAGRNTSGDGPLGSSSLGAPELPAAPCP